MFQSRSLPLTQAVAVAAAAGLTGCAAEPAPATEPTPAKLVCINPEIVNPSFEQPRITPPFQRFTDTLPGWTGEVDVHDRTDLPAAEGLQSVDLNAAGRSARPLAQALRLTPGAQYELRFSHAVNHHCSAMARFSVRIGGVYRTYASDTTMREEHLFFISREDGSLLEFQSLTEGCGAATIDDVHVTCSLAPREWPNSESRANSDRWLVDHHDAIAVMRPRIAVINYSNFLSVDAAADATVAAIRVGSRYHGYANPSAPAFLEPQIVSRNALRDTTLFTRSLGRANLAPIASADRWVIGRFDNVTGGGPDLARIYPSGGQTVIDVYSGSGGGYSAQRTWATVPKTALTSPVPPQWFAGDVDGDGFDDLIKLFDDGGLASVEVFQSTTREFTRSTWAIRSGPIAVSQQWMVGDINGDRRADLIVAYGDRGLASVDAMVSTGTGFVRSTYASQQGGFWNGQKWLAADVDGNGTADLVNVFGENGLTQIDVHTSNGAALDHWGRWSFDDGGFWNDQKWLAGDFDHDGHADLANVFGDPDDPSQISVDVHLSNGVAFRRSRWETRNGGFSTSQIWMVADVNGGGFADLVNVFPTNVTVSVDHHVTRANHSSAPRRPSRPSDWDYAQMFTQAYASSIGIVDPATGQPRPLCDLIARGDIHELWFYVDPRDDSAPKGQEIVESKQRYDVNGQPIPGQFSPCAGNDCLPDDAAAAAQICGRTVRIVGGDATRTAGCLVHSLGHGMEIIGGRNATPGADIVPTLAADFRRFANFDLASRLHLPQPTWYAMCGVAGGLPGGLPCDAPVPGSCLTPQAPNQVHWTSFGDGLPLPTGDITAYDQGCGSVHFPPNARGHDDVLSCIPMLSTCATFGARNGVGSRDNPEPYTSDAASALEVVAPGCGGGWQLYWRQSFPGRENTAVNQDGIAMPNWWPFVYY